MLLTLEDCVDLLDLQSRNRRGYQCAPNTLRRVSNRRKITPSRRSCTSDTTHRGIFRTLKVSKSSGTRNDGSGQKTSPPGKHPEHQNRHSRDQHPGTSPNWTKTRVESPGKDSSVETGTRLPRNWQRRSTCLVTPSFPNLIPDGFNGDEAKK